MRNGMATFPGNAITRRFAWGWCTEEEAMQEVPSRP